MRTTTKVLLALLLATGGTLYVKQGIPAEARAINASIDRGAAHLRQDSKDTKNITVGTPADELTQTVEDLQVEARSPVAQASAIINPEFAQSLGELVRDLEHIDAKQNSAQHQYMEAFWHTNGIWVRHFGGAMNKVGDALEYATREAARRVGLETKRKQLLGWLSGIHDQNTYKTTKEMASLISDKSEKERQLDLLGRTFSEYQTNIDRELRRVSGDIKTAKETEEAKRKEARDLEREAYAQAHSLATALREDYLRAVDGIRDTYREERNIADLAKHIGKAVRTGLQKYEAAVTEGDKYQVLLELGQEVRELQETGVSLPGQEQQTVAQIIAGYAKQQKEERAKKAADVVAGLKNLQSLVKRQDTEGLVRMYDSFEILRDEYLALTDTPADQVPQVLTDLEKRARSLKGGVDLAYDNANRRKEVVDAAGGPLEQSSNPADYGTPIAWILNGIGAIGLVYLRSKFRKNKAA